MAEFLVSKILDQLTDVVFRQLDKEIKLVTGVKNEIKSLSSKLKMIKELLQDAEGRKMKLRDLDAGTWLEQLEDVAYEMDDVLDKWNTEVHRLKLKGDEHSNSTSSEQKEKAAKNLKSSILKWKKVRSFILSICSCFKQVPVRHDIAQKIKELNESLSTILKEGNEFNFVASGRSSSLPNLERVITTSMFDESEVSGRTSEKDTIVRWLIPDRSSSGKDRLSVVSIVGTGGIGKTNLAQLVYNDNRVKEHFEMRHWVCVSDPFDEERIAKAILQGLGKSINERVELQTLLNLIKDSISGKKFLLVLDDVWTDKDTKWKPIWYSLKHGAPGSRILVTTRKQTVALMMESRDNMLRLDQLRDLDCWAILRRIAFSGRSEEERQRLEKIGWEIAKKCKGLPLAARFMGSLLRFKFTIEQWQGVLDDETWELKEAGVDLFPHLYLSYSELSPALKRCFSYCAVFPKDSKLEVEKLIRLWMAQGYLGSTSRKAKNLELEGRECFDGLAMRSFFQEFDRDIRDNTTIISCKMHDIVHDFAQYLTRNECLIIGELGEGTSLTDSGEKARHLTWLRSGEDIAVSSVVDDVGRLRSFYSKSTVPPDLFCRAKSLRLLSLSGIGRGIGLEEVSREVGKLIHLRCLDLSENKGLRELPEAICDLYNLETLDVSECHSLIQLPQRIGNLANLRHLLNFSGHRYMQFPQGFEKLTSLKTLKEFNVGDKYGKLGYLKGLNQLEGDLCLGLFEINKMDVENAQLRNKKHILNLILTFKDSRVKGFVIEALQVPPSLQGLGIGYFPDTKMPSWIVTSVNNLRELRIIGGKLTSLPALGKLPSLETLSFTGLYSLEHLGQEFLGTKEILNKSSNLNLHTAAGSVAFPKLKKLEFWDLKNWETWEDLSEDEEKFVPVMPRLQDLELYYCPKLRELPHRIIRKACSLHTLELRGCDNMTERYKKGRGVDWINISHIPNVVIV